MTRKKMRSALIVMRAVLAPHPRKTVGQDAALQGFAKRLRYIGQWGVLVALAIELAGAIALPVRQRENTSTPTAVANHMKLAQHRPSSISHWLSQPG